MRVSEEKKQETKRAIVASAADLFVLQGYEDTSMKEIARHAGIGDATIYKYFPNKDKLILGFYDVRGELALSEYYATEGIEEYSFHEKLQLAIDTLIEQLLADREFIDISLTQILKSPLSLMKDQLSILEKYTKLFESMLDELEAREDYPSIALKSATAHLITDFLLGILVYWIKDDSEEFSNTNQLVDISVSTIDSLLKSGVIIKFMDLAGFLIKTQLMRFLSGSGNVLSVIQQVSESLNQKNQNR